MIDLLSEVKVIDLTHVHAGPLCTYQLGLMGAEIIKVEPPETGDQMRSMGRLGDGPLMSAGFTGQSANKQSIVIDLKSTAGLADYRTPAGAGGRTARSGRRSAADESDRASVVVRESELLMCGIAAKENVG